MMVETIIGEDDPFYEKLRQTTTTATATNLEPTELQVGFVSLIEVLLMKNFHKWELSAKFDGWRVIIIESDVVQSGIFIFIIYGCLFIWLMTVTIQAKKSVYNVSYRNFHAIMK